MSKKFGVLMLGAALIAFSPLALAQSSNSQNEQTQEQQAQPAQQAQPMTPEQQEKQQIEQHNTQQSPCGDKGYSNVPGC